MTWDDDEHLTPVWSQEAEAWFTRVLKRSVSDAVSEASRHRPFPHELLLPKVVAYYLGCPTNYTAWTDLDAAGRHSARS